MDAQKPKRKSLAQIRLERQKRAKHNQRLNLLFICLAAVVLIMIPFLISSTVKTFRYSDKLSVVTRQLGEEKNQSLPQDEESVSQSLVASMEELQNERDTLTAQNSQAQEELASMEAQITSIQEQLAAAAPSEPENPPAAEPVQEPTAPSNTGNGKTIYLTFDDGPSYLTGQILDILDQYGIKATFFVTYTEKPEIVPCYQEIVNRGHSIGIHTASHDYDYIYSNFENFKADFMKIYTYVGDLTGVYCDLYRFPGGSMNLSGRACFMADEIRTFLSQMYCVYFDWNVTNGDGEDVTADLAYQNVMNEIEGRNTPVILMHDGEKKESTVESLPRILDTLIAQGYSFERLTTASPQIQQGVKWDT
ncbi:MAG: polysaccharide deacetylase family protein [Lachnospiraceae bacterium]|nr:polysaccharide deacetylase family protein [Candidatus Fimimorpha excrementavium]